MTRHIPAIVLRDFQEKIVKQLLVQTINVKTEELVKFSDLLTTVNVLMVIPEHTVK